jgi:hypothetical protein
MDCDWAKGEFEVKGGQKTILQRGDGARERMWLEGRMLLREKMCPLG